MPPLAALTPATASTKFAIPLLLGRDFLRICGSGGADALIVSGSEIDVCVLATVLGAVDMGTV